MCQPSRLSGTIIIRFWDRKGKMVGTLLVLFGKTQKFCRKEDVTNSIWRSWNTLATGNLTWHWGSSAASFLTRMCRWVMGFRPFMNNKYNHNKKAGRHSHKQSCNWHILTYPTQRPRQILLQSRAYFAQTISSGNLTVRYGESTMFNTSNI